MESDGRKHPPHEAVRDYFNTATIVFLTVCTKDRRALLAKPRVHQLLVSAWSLRSTWMVGRYVLMPDHVHLFCAPATMPTLPLQPWVRFWKSKVSQVRPGGDGSSSNLAAAFLGHSAAKGRELRGEMVVCGQ